MPLIILASRSPARKKVLQSLGIDFTVMPTNIDERKITASSPFLLVKKLARMKGEMVKVRRQETGASKKGVNSLAPNSQLPASIILAADSLAIIETKMVKDKNLIHRLTKYRLGNYYLLGKPQTIEEAKLFLSILSAKTHFFITGLFVKRTKDKVIYQSITKTKVVFNKISQKEIDNYVKTQPVLTFAGAYQIEKGTPGEKFVRKLCGSYTNVLGLPEEELVKFLKEWAGASQARK